MVRCIPNMHNREPDNSQALGRVGSGREGVKLSLQRSQLNSNWQLYLLVPPGLASEPNPCTTPGTRLDTAPRASAPVRPSLARCTLRSALVSNRAGVASTAGGKLAGCRPGRTGCGRPGPGRELVTMPGAPAARMALALGAAALCAVAHGATVSLRTLPGARRVRLRVFDRCVGSA